MVPDTGISTLVTNKFLGTEYMDDLCQESRHRREVNPTIQEQFVMKWVTRHRTNWRPLRYAEACLQALLLLLLHLLHQFDQCHQQHAADSDAVCHAYRPPLYHWVHPPHVGRGCFCRGYVCALGHSDHVYHGCVCAGAYGHGRDGDGCGCRTHGHGHGGGHDHAGAHGRAHVHDDESVVARMPVL